MFGRKSLILLLSLALPLILLFAGAFWLIKSPSFAYGFLMGADNFKGLVAQESLPDRYKSPQFEEVQEGGIDMSNWGVFQFLNFSLSLPSFDPSYIPAPVIKFIDKDNKKIQLGLEIYNLERIPLVSLYFLPPQLFNFKLSHSSFFEIPLVRYWIGKRDRQNIFKDLFSLDLSSSPKDYEELSYFIFIAELRLRSFPEKTKSFFYLKEKETGIIELTSTNASYRAEAFYTLASDGKVASYLLRTRLEYSEADQVRQNMIMNIKGASRGVGDVDLLYKEFKSLAFADKIIAKGFLILLSALSLDLGNEGLVREIIFYLEKGNAQMFQLEPLYNYSFEKFGTNYSNIPARLRENAERALMRRARLEREQEEERERDKLLNSVGKDPDLEEQEVKKLSPEERIKYFLKKGREENPNAPKVKKRLIMD